MQLVLIRSSLAIFAKSESGIADAVWTVGDLKRGTALRATARCFALATFLGASTVMPGSVVAEPVAVCDIAGPLRPNVSSANDEMATARLEKKRDESPIAISSE
jgi:hypothetical protein